MERRAQAAQVTHRPLFLFFSLQDCLLSVALHDCLSSVDRRLFPQVRYKEIHGCSVCCVRCLCPRLCLVFVSMFVSMFMPVVRLWCLHVMCTPISVSPSVEVVCDVCVDNGEYACV